MPETIRQKFTLSNVYRYTTLDLCEGDIEALPLDDECRTLSRALVDHLAAHPEHSVLRALAPWLVRRVAVRSSTKAVLFVGTTCTPALAKVFINYIHDYQADSSGTPLWRGVVCAIAIPLIFVLFNCASQVGCAIAIR